MNKIIELLLNTNFQNIFFTFILSFLESLLYFFSIKYIFKSNISRKRAYFFCITTTLIAIFTTFLKSPYSDIINLSNFILQLKFTFRQKTLKSVLILIFLYLITLTSSVIFELIIQILFKITFSNLFTIPIYRFICSLGIYSIFALISFLILKRKDILHKIKVKVNFTILLNFIFGLTSLLILSTVFKMYDNILPMNIKFICLTSLSLYFIFSIVSLIRTQKLEQTKQELEHEKKYSKTLSILYDNIRGFKHDFNNIIQVIGGYILSNDIRGLKDYYSTLLAECQANNQIEKLNPNSICNPSIYSLLANSYHLACDKNIQYDFTIDTILDLNGLNTFNISRILRILLDNAIEAAEETKNKIVSISIHKDEKKYIIIISNSYINHNLQSTQLFKKGFTTKSQGSGLGLWQVHKILSKNTSLDLCTTCTENIFTQKFFIYFK